MRGGCRWRAVVELVREGKNPEERIDQSVKKILYYKFRLGLFENRYTAQPAADSGPVLPLAAPERIFVTGTNADNQTILGDWAMKQSDENVVTVLRGIREAAPAGSQIDYLDIGSGFQIPAIIEAWEPGMNGRGSNLSRDAGQRVPPQIGRHCYENGERVQKHSHRTEYIL